MFLTQKIKAFERQIVFMRWGASGEFGKIKYVGRDFIEFEVIDIENFEYSKTVIINPNVVLEIELGSPDVNRIIAAVSCNLPPAEDKI